MLPKDSTFGRPCSTKFVIMVCMSKATCSTLFAEIIPVLLELSPRGRRLVAVVVARVEREINIAAMNC